mmetsp:Transcript_6029/g.7479  ORF Transcript_6029/g.7479 Transcript_6029/m.7479 type:complete len:278 (-) Transcript_6029:58-891(-)
MMFELILFGFCVDIIISDPSPPSTPSCGSLPLVNGTFGAVCIPNVCDYDTCPQQLGKCSGNYANTGNCTYNSGNYSGILSYPYGVSTYYCSLESGGCTGGSCGDPVSNNYVKSWNVDGIAAVNPLIFGLDQNRNNINWGQSCTKNSNICYYISGPGGSANVMITDRCAGYCRYNNNYKCSLNGNEYLDCGACDLVNQDASQISPGCPCIGTDGNLHTECCGPGCPTLSATCDWCSGNNHPHFDLNTEVYNHVCGSDAPKGHCVLNKILPYICHQTNH